MSLRTCRVPSSQVNDPLDDRWLQLTLLGRLGALSQWWLHGYTVPSSFIVDRKVSIPRVLSVCLSVCLFVCVSVCLSVSVSVSVCLCHSIIRHIGAQVTAHTKR